MNFYFEVEDAVNYGVNEAIFIQNLKHWIIKNRANKKHYHDGRTWTYNSLEAFLEIFPFWTRQNLRTITNKLIQQNIILKGNFNSSPYDKTTWYAFVDEENMLPRLVNSNQCTTTQPREEKLLASPNNDALVESNQRFAQINQPIPDNKHTDNKQKIKKQTKKKTSASPPDFVLKVFNHWVTVFNVTKAKLIPKRQRKIEQAIASGWTIEELCLAIDGCKNSKWHQGENDRGMVYDELELILRDEMHIRQFIKLATTIDPQQAMIAQMKRELFGSMQ